MENNCLLTKLRGVVANDNLVKIGHIRVFLTWPNSGFSFNPILGSNSGGTSGRVKYGNVYKDSDYTELITNNLPIPQYDYNNITIFQNPDEHKVSCIELNIMNLWTFAVSPETFKDEGQAYGYNWYNVGDLESLIKNSTASIFNFSTLFLNPNQSVKIERLFELLYNRIHNQEINLWENPNTTAWFPCIFNDHPLFIDSQKNMTWKNETFFSKRLYMSTDYANSQFHLYSHMSNFSQSYGYTLTDRVATYNATSKQWTYYV